jgi:D-glycero-alpha-D-manno-heptose-7-phosphate kinase
MGKVTARQRLVMTITPQRLSFVGGGTDLREFYSRSGGSVVSMAIDKYIYITVKDHSPLFGEKYRVNYSVTEHVDKLDAIQNSIARECLRLVEVEPPLYVSTVADLPASSGLGSSSSFAVGLLHALHTLRGEEVSAGQLAEEACHIEIQVLKRPIGKQDQYAAAFGGLNHIMFSPDERVSIDHLWLGDEAISLLMSCSLMFWTGIQRDAADILVEQQRNIGNRLEELQQIRDCSLACRDLMLRGFDPVAFGRLLDESWRAKRSLSPHISNSRIDHWYAKALEAGALGGKLAGAGGGGFLYILAPPERQAAVRAALSDMPMVRIGYEPHGSRVLASIAF